MPPSNGVNQHYLIRSHERRKQFPDIMAEKVAQNLASVRITPDFGHYSKKYYENNKKVQPKHLPP